MLSHLHWALLICYLCRFVVHSKSVQFRGAIKLELPCPRNVEGVSVDPDLDWSFDALLSELSAVEQKLNSSSPFLAAPFSERRSRYLLAYVSFAYVCLNRLFGHSPVHSRLGIFPIGQMQREVQLPSDCASQKMSMRWRTQWMTVLWPATDLSSTSYIWGMDLTLTCKQLQFTIWYVSDRWEFSVWPIDTEKKLFLGLSMGFFILWIWWFYFIIIIL